MPFENGIEENSGITQYEQELFELQAEQGKLHRMHEPFDKLYPPKHALHTLLLLQDKQFGTEHNIQP